MTVSVLGTGRMAQGLMKVLTPHVRDLMWASRSTEKAQNLIKDLGYDVKAVDYTGALSADIIIHTLWFRDVMPWVKEHQEQLAGKVFVDISNPFTPDFSNFSTEWGTSAAEEIQRMIPQTKVVGAFKNTFWPVFDSPVHQSLQSDVYVTSDDAEAKSAVMNLLTRLPFRILDGGALQNNRTIERMTLFERELAIRYGHYPTVSFRLWGGEY